MNNDLISREALKKAIKNLYNETLDGIVKFGIEKAYKEIDHAPTVERPQGEWIIKQGKTSWWYECDKCGERPARNYLNNDYLSKFCPNCGAKMTTGDEEAKT